MKRLLRLITLPLLAVAITIAVIPSQGAFACTTNEATNEQTPRFLGLPSWHHYLSCPDGNIELTKDADGNIELGQLWLIAAAVLEFIIRLGGLIAVIYVIWGGFKYITSQGSPDSTSAARKTITYALTGLIISIFSSILVSFAMDLLVGRATGIDPTTGLPLTTEASEPGLVGRILRLLYAIAGVVAAIYIAVGSLKFVTSNGDPQKAASARQTIIYALVGLVVILTAYILTGFVVSYI